MKYGKRHLGTPTYESRFSASSAESRGGSDRQRDDETRPAPRAIIYRSEFDYISKCIRDYPDIETGGQLFGFITEYGVPVVCYVIGPGPRANHQPTFFNQDTAYLQTTYTELNRRYGLRFIGEWHSHHQLGLARPSGHDATTIVHGIQRHGFRHFLLSIGNIDRAGRTTANAFTFHLDNPYDYSHAPWQIIEMESPYRPIVDREMRGRLYHPRTSAASHGTNYLLDAPETVMKVTPDYRDDYWLNNKENNLVLKKIIDFLSAYGDGGVVKPQMDSEKHVHLKVIRDERQEQIVFGDRFPLEPPRIIVSDDVTVNGVAVWPESDDIFASFEQYYTDYFTIKPPTSVPVNLVEGFVDTVLVDPDELAAFKSSSEQVVKGTASLNFDIVSRRIGNSVELSMKDDLRASEMIFNTDSGDFEKPADCSVKFNPVSKEFDLLLSFSMTAWFYKDKATGIAPDSFVIEDIQTDAPQAFYCHADGEKKKLVIGEKEKLVGFVDTISRQ